MDAGGKGGLPPGMTVLDRLYGEQRIARDVYEAVVLHARRVGERIEEAIIQTGAMSEADLLKYLAALYKTRFVTSSKLAKATIERTTLDRVPRKLAERLHVFPILYDRGTHTLSVVAVEVETVDVAKQVQLVSEAREVLVYIARPAAIEALVRKHYHGDRNAFAVILRDASAGAADFGFGADPHSIPLGTGGGGFGDDFEAVAPRAAPARGAPARAKAPPPPPDFRIDAPEVAAALAAQQSPRARRQSVPPTEALVPATPAAPAPATPPPVTAVAFETQLEVVGVLIALLEQGRGELRGHGARVAQVAKKLCERMGLSPTEAHGVLIAAQLHDLGKGSSYHLTAFNVAQYEGHRLQAQKTHLAPVRLFESAKLPETTDDALAHLYERFDGQGFPDRLAGKDIPLGARLLAVAESYADLTGNPKNPYRKQLTPTEACNALAGLAGTVFDPTVVDVLRHTVFGDDLRQKLLADRRTVLLVDPDPEETTILEMRLVEQGYDVDIERDAERGAERVARGGIDVVIAEAELTPFDGFELVRRLRAASPQLPTMFLTRRGDRESVQKGFGEGAADYVIKPASAELVAAKVKLVLERGAGAEKPRSGVTGTLREMSLPDVIQILSNGRKSGRLQLRAGGKAGEVQFAEGMICDASFGDVSGAPAFYAMLALTDGEFSLDPSFKPTSNRINLPTESLLLEGMRLLDETQK